MRTDIILSKLESLRRCIQRIESKKPIALDQLKNDMDLQDILVINLERAVQQAVDIGLALLSQDKGKSPGGMAQTFLRLSEQKIIPDSLGDSLAKSVGFRNIAVHEYEKLSWDIVFAITESGLQNFKDFARIVLQKIQ